MNGSPSLDAVLDPVAQRPEGSTLPDPITYEQEYQFWPWGKLLDLVVSWVEANAQPRATVIDYMCGTGYLLNQVSQLRPDLNVMGCDISHDFIRYAQRAYPAIDVTLCDALIYEPEYSPDVILCTAGLHHLKRNLQPSFIEKIAFELSPNGFFVLGEEVIRPYLVETERKYSVHEMWSSLLSHLIAVDAPENIIQAALNVELDDLFETSEYKVSLPALTSMLSTFFHIEEVVQVWPKHERAFGDVLLICRRK